MKDNIKLFGRISLTMLAVGIGLALTSYVLMWWVGVTELAGEESLIRGDALTDLASLVSLLVIILSAPVVAGIVGIFEGLRDADPLRGLWVGAGCLMGAVLLIVVAAFVLGLATSGDGGPAPLELLTIAGLTSVASAVAGTFSAILAD